MKLVESLLLGSAAGLVGIAGAQGADLPARKSAPVEYVRICDAYGAGFFYIPGTDTCLRVGGLALAEFRAFNPSYVVNVGAITGNGTAKGAVLGAGTYSNQRQRDGYGYAALGRLELDARTRTAYGTLRSFIRVDSYFGANSGAVTGSLQGAGESTILNKAFIQFAGLTAGRAQSMFDFYADAYNYELLRGSNATVALLAYTATFGGGFSASLSLEDQASRRAPIGSTVTGFQATPAGTRIPDIVGNIRVDQPWGSVQLAAAAHQNNTTLFASPALATPPAAYAFPSNSQNNYGFAIQGGAQFNLDQWAPGDKLWLQATYEKGAVGYIQGLNLGFSGGPVNGNRYMGVLSYPYIAGWNRGFDLDCVWTGSGTCEQQWGFAVVAALKHYWLPTLSSSVYGSYMEIHYTANAIAGFGGAIGVPNLKETRIGSNLVWTPVKGFDIGAEFMYVRGANSFPVGQFVIPAGLPAFQSTQNVYETRLRVLRAF
jgi:hypothetical protein